MLTFNEERHEYQWGGVVVPSVTQVLKGLTSYDHIPPDTLERARQEGTAVHYMVECACKGIEVDLPEWMNGRWVAWQRFCVEADFDVWLSEHLDYHRAMRFAGTMDLVGEIKGLKKDFCGPAIIDVKRSFYGGPAIGLQIAGYRLLLEQDKALPRFNNRFALQLILESDRARRACP